MIMVLSVLILAGMGERPGVASYQSNTNTNTITTGGNFIASASIVSQAFHYMPLSAVMSSPLDVRGINHATSIHDTMARGYAGIDEDDYLGDDAMRWLIHNTNLKWTAFFLAPGPSEHNTSWMTKYHYLRELGWGIAPIFFGQQEPGVVGPHILTTEQGILDARQAIKLANQAGIPQHSVIFLDIETAGNLSSNFLNYYTAWIKEIMNNKFKAGAYCYFYKTADQLHSIDYRVVFWVYNLNKYNCIHDGHFPYPEPNPSKSGVSYAYIWQIIQTCSIKSDGRIIPEVDLNSAFEPNPSQIKILTFYAEMTGAKDVPPIATNAMGIVKFQLSNDNNSLVYEIDLRNVNGVLSANLYQRNGSIVTQLLNPYIIHTPTGPINGKFLQGNLTSGNLFRPSLAKILDLVSLMKAGDIYVKIRTAQYESGEIGGKISQVS